MSGHDIDETDDTDDDTGGQVSEVQRLDVDEADAPVDDSQGVAGNPDAPDIGEAGPNANPHRDQDTH